MIPGKLTVTKRNAFLTCPEGPGSEPFPPEIYEQVDQTVWIDRISGKVINMHP